MHPQYAFLSFVGLVIATTSVHVDVLEASTTPVTPKGFGIYALPNLPQDILQLLNVGNSAVATSRRDRTRNNSDIV